MSTDNKTFIISLRYMEPVEGTSYITAKSEEAAREKAEKLFSWHQQFEIVDVTESTDSQLVLDLKAEAEEAAFNQMIGLPTHPKKEDIN